MICEKHPEKQGRRTKDGRCVGCETDRRTEYRARNIEREQARRLAYRERERELDKVRRESNPNSSRERSRRWREKYPDKVKFKNAANYAADPKKAKQRVDEWRKANPDKVRNTARKWRENNPDRAAEIRSMSIKRWVAKYPERKAAATRLYQAAKRQAVAPWANRKAMLAFYEEARRLTKETGVPHHVDHIIPINHPTICGLHVETNLQVIPAAENVRKGNRLTALSA